MTRHPDEADEAILLGLHHTLQSAAGREGCPQLLLIDQVVELDQIDPVRAQPFQRALDLVVGLGPSTFTGLGGEKELVAVSLDPGTKSQLCVAVACGGVDVVDPMLADQLDRLISLVLTDVAQGCLLYTSPS